MFCRFCTLALLSLDTAPLSLFPFNPTPTRSLLLNLEVQDVRMLCGERMPNLRAHLVLLNHCRHSAGHPHAPGRAAAQHPPAASWWPCQWCLCLGACERPGALCVYCGRWGRVCRPPVIVSQLQSHLQAQPHIEELARGGLHTFDDCVHCDDGLGVPSGRQRGKRLPLHNHHRG